jgi:hypothetical protein
MANTHEGIAGYLAVRCIAWLGVAVAFTKDFPRGQIKQVTLSTLVRNQKRAVPNSEGSDENVLRVLLQSAVVPDSINALAPKLSAGRSIFGDDNADRPTRCKVSDTSNRDGLDRLGSEPLRADISRPEDEKAAGS